MTVHHLTSFGQALSLNARLFPDRPGASDLERSMSFLQWNRRSCQLANALLGLGLTKGDRVAILAYNCVEWMEIYAATAKTGIVAVPVNFRLTGGEIQFIAENCGAKAVIVQDTLAENIEAVRGELSIPEQNFIHFGPSPCPAGYRTYEEILGAARDSEPECGVLPDEPWFLMYTSGTTGLPKGAIRSHRASCMTGLIGDVEIGFGRADSALLVMPLCHANSVFFANAFSYVGAPCVVYSRSSFDPEHLIRVLSESGITFTSLVPTHYIMMLGLPDAVRAKYDVSPVRKLLISSAPARQETKQATMEYFANAGLYELYGSTEAGIVTTLHPDEQFSKLGSIGREVAGSRPIKLLDPDGNEVPDGEAGELFSCAPGTFDGYWDLPEKTAEAFRGDYCSVGDLARRDEDGFYFLVDRKSNMIISGGENVYPSEVEAMLGAHENVKDVAVIGMPDEKWGERVHAVIISHESGATDEDAILDWCQGRIAGYKRPRSVSFIREEDMPRTATGKIQHRALRINLTKDLD